MQLHFCNNPLAHAADLTTDALLVPVLQGESPAFSAVGQQLEEVLEGQLSEELAYFQHFKWAVGETHVMNLSKDAPFRALVLVGMGKPAESTAKSMRRSFAAGFRAAQTAGLHSVGALVETVTCEKASFTPAQVACWLAEAALLATYQFTARRTEASLKPQPLAQIQLAILNNGKQAVDEQAIQQGFARGRVEAEATCLARDWVFDSSNHLTPTALKTYAETTLVEGGLKLTALTLEDIRSMGMGAFYSVAKGSTEPAYLLHLSYTPKNIAPKKTVALVGKGITFDSGGLSLKPSASMELMKLDMAGAAAVLATMAGLLKLREVGIEIPLQVEGFVGLAENMPSGGASKPGDIVTTLAGKTVEINNTDAEGRLVLIDTLTYAQRTANPDEIIDLATLTGAAVAALGEVAAAIMSPSEEFQKAIIASGAEAGEQFWPLPLYDEYKESLKSDVADLINAGSKGKAGTASAALFLKEFIDDERRWAHLDIAGPAYTSTDVPEAPKGATGFGVRTLLHYLLSH